MKIKISLIKTLASLGLLFSLLTFISQLGQFHWTLGVLSHYHIQYTIMLAFCLAALLLLKQWRAYLLILLAALILNLSFVAPFFVPVATNRAIAATDAAPLRVMAMNISTETAGYGKVVDLIRERQPDIVFMSEVRADLVALLQEQLVHNYPYLHAEPSRFTLGIAFLSRHPFRAIKTVEMDTLGGPMHRRYLRAELDWQGQAITLVGIHPLPPMNGAWSISRDRELELMGQIAQTEKQPFILLGDLNASPWSQPMRQLLAQTELRYANKGYGVGITWRLAGVWLGAPLDHILISPQWEVADYSEEGDIGSDHLPIQADLMLIRR